MRILGISGSLRRDSHNTRLLRAAALALPPGAELELLDGLAAVPPYSEDADTEPAPEAVAHLRDQIAAADALLIATPEYNASIPGVLKNAIDWMSRPSSDIDRVFKGKPVAILGASPGSFGTARGQAAWLGVLRAVQLRPFFELPPFYLAKAHQSFTPDGGFADPKSKELLTSFLAGFVAFAAK